MGYTGPSMAAEVERYEEDVELSPAQVAALEKLHDLGASPAPKGEDGKSIYDSNSQIRALQLVYEGRLGGAGRGQGRKRKPRVGQVVAEEMRKRSSKIVSAIEKGLDSDNERTALTAAEMAVRIDREEAALSLKEEEVDNVDNMTKEELVATLIQLASDPGTEAQLEAVIDIPEEDIQEVTSDDDGEDGAASGSEAPAHSAPARAHKRAARSNGRGSGSRNRPKGPNPFKAIAGGRAAD